jgi:hypothetical protein
MGPRQRRVAGRACDVSKLPSSELLVGFVALADVVGAIVHNGVEKRDRRFARHINVADSMSCGLHSSDCGLRTLHQ